MNSKLCRLWFLIIMSANLSSSWSATINGMFHTKPITPQKLQNGLNPTLLDSIAVGAQLAMDECRNVFKWDRWNCPESAFSRQARQIQTKETAFVEAITAAGIIYSITKNCSRGEFRGCGCGSMPDPGGHQNWPQVQRDWTWGGCSDDTSYGEEIVRTYFAVEKLDSDLQQFIISHNSRIGQQIVAKMRVKKCKCHGVSGMCSVQTCWMEMAPFALVAAALRRYYDDALRMQFGNTAHQLPPEDTTLEERLVYLQESPNFCLEDARSGWPGTVGRSCSRRSIQEASGLTEKRSCRNLCRTCGHRVRKQRKTQTYRCNCKFEWCCEVKCEICIRNVEEFFCQ